MTLCQTVATEPNIQAYDSYDFYDLISKTDRTVTKCDFTENNLASIFPTTSQPGHISSVAQAEAWHHWDQAVGGSTPAEDHLFSQVMMR